MRHPKFAKKIFVRLAGNHPAMLGILLTLLIPSCWGQYVYVGGGRAVSGFVVDPTTGALAQIPGSPFAAEDTTTSVAVDPGGRFVYATLNGSGVSAFTIDPQSGALSEISGSPFATGAGANYVTVTPGGFVYVSNGGDQTVSGFSMDQTTGALTPIPGSPFPFSGIPVGLEGDPSGRFLYVGISPGAFPHSEVIASFGVAGYQIDATTGVLTAIPGSPFLFTVDLFCGMYVCLAPHAIAVDPLDRYVYLDLTTSLSVGGAYTIDPSTGALTGC